MWAVGALLYFWLADPDWLYHRRRVLEDKLLGLMLIPPLFFGVVWFGYKRFVDLRVADTRPTCAETEHEDSTKPDRE